MRVFVLLGFLTLVAACTPQATLFNSEWTLIKINDASVTVTKSPTIQFQENENKMAGFAGCNRYFGSYAIQGKTLTFSGVGSTKMFCNETMDIEQQFLGALQKVDAFEVNENTLMLYSQKQIVLEFNR